MGKFQGTEKNLFVVLSYKRLLPLKNTLLKWELKELNLILIIKLSAISSIAKISEFKKKLLQQVICSGHWKYMKSITNKWETINPKERNFRKDGDL